MLAASAVLLGAAPASAATQNVTFVTSADFTGVAQHATVTPGWHYQAAAAPTSGLSGLVLAANSYYGIGYTAGTAGTSLASFAQSVVLGTQSTLGPAFEVGVYYETSPGVGGSFVFTQNSVTGSINPASLWSTGVGGAAFGTLVGAHTLAEYDTEAATAYPGFVVTGWGFHTDNAITISDLKVNGTQYIFTPQPVVTVAPASPLLRSVATSTGVSVTTNGFLPGETVAASVGDGSVGSAVADANGLVTFSYVFPATTTVGSYALTLTGAVPDPQLFSIVLQDPAAPVLAETGSNPTFGLTLAGSLLLLGATLAVVSATSRRRRPRHTR